MPRLFIPASAVHDGTVHVGGAAARHLAGSLRTRPGDTVALVDDSGTEYRVVVETASAESVHGRVVSSGPATGEPRLQVEVVQALAKDGMDDAVDAMVQAGVSVIRPVITERTVSRPDADRAGRRAERWQSIARETAQLAFRARVPTVMPVMTLGQALDDATARPARLLACVIGPEAAPLRAIDLTGTGRVCICIGPEGGFGDADLSLLRDHDAAPVHLGTRVFRARLAGAVAATVVLAAAGDLDTPQAVALDGAHA